MPANFPGPPEPAIHRAARLGDLAHLKELVTSGVDINLAVDLAFDYGSYLQKLTPLMVAAASTEGASLSTVRWLVDNGADVFAKSEAGRTAAWYAAGGLEAYYFQSNHEQSDHDERLQFLLDSGLDVNECSEVGRCLLNEACRAGDPRRVRLLLEKGAKTDRAQTGGDRLYSFQIPLFCAAEAGSAECVHLLLEIGEAADVRDGMSRTPLMVAGSAEAARALIAARADVHAVNEFGDDTLEVVLKECCDDDSKVRKLEVARVLLQAGADIEWRDKFGHTRLYSMAFRRVPSAVRFVLEAGAGLHASQGESGTPLHAVCWQGESDQETNDATTEIIKILAKAGINVNVRDEKGNTPLIESAGGDRGNATAIRTLVNFGADPKLGNKRGANPLMIAAAGGESECLKELLKSGVDPRTADNGGQTPLDYATEHLEIWKSINADPSQIDIGVFESQEEVARRIREQLAQAEECVKLLGESLRTDR